MCSEQGKCWLQWLLFARSSNIQYPISISRDLYCITQAEALANKIHVYPSLWGLFINDVITLRGDWGMITILPRFFFISCFVTIYACQGKGLGGHEMT